MSNKWSAPKDRAELEAALQRQLANFRRSMSAYDEGALEEAERLAASVYILVHTGTRDIVALLDRLHLLSSMKFIDSSAYRYDPTPPRQAVTVDGVTTQTVKFEFGLPLCETDLGDDTARFVPRRGSGAAESPYRMTDFQDWWKQEIYETAAGKRLTRNDLVIALGNQESGRHVDAVHKSEAYVWLATAADKRLRIQDGMMSMDIEIRFDGAPEQLTGTDPVGQPVMNGHWATMRQIAWELDESLKRIGL